MMKPFHRSRPIFIFWLLVLLPTDWKAEAKPIKGIAIGKVTKHGGLYNNWVHKPKPGQDQNGQEYGPPTEEASIDATSSAEGTGSTGTKVLVRFDVQLSSSSTGSFVVEVNPEWAPLGAQRFLDLVDGNGPDGLPNPEVSGDSFWNGLRFFRVVNNFVAQFGIAGEPAVSAIWQDARIVDDPVLESNLRGYLSFATSGTDSRTTQMFINFKDNTRLDNMGFSPFAKVVEGMDIVDAIYDEYGEQPSQHDIQGKGNSYLENNFPNLSYITSVKRVDDSIEAEKETEDDLQ